MTRDDIIRMAREAGLPPAVYDSPSILALCEAVARRSASAEREACAKVCADLAMFADCAAESDTIWKCMEAIRARSNNV